MPKRSWAHRFADRRGVVAGFALFAVVTAGSALSQSGLETLRKADGILLRLRSGQDGVTVDWRFLRTPPAPVRRVEVELNGQPLGLPAMPIEPFPARGQSAALEVLAGHDEGYSLSVRSSLSTLSTLLPTRVELKIQDIKAGARTAPDGASESDAVNGGGRQISRLDLASALEQGIDEIAARPADRRALLVFPETMASAPFSVDALSARAKAHSIAIYVVGGKQKRSSEFAALAVLSQVTDGGTIDADADLVDALSRTFLSGAELRFPYGTATRYLWQSAAVVTASLLYGDHKLLAAIDADPPSAGWARSVEEVWKRSASYASAFAAGALLMLAAVAAFRFFHRPRIV